MPEQATSTAIRDLFLTGSRISQAGSQAELASLARADEWLNSPPLTAPACAARSS